MTTASFPLASDEAFPPASGDDLRCGECRRAIPNGYPYIAVPDGMVEETPMQMIVCVYCGPPR